MIEFDSNVSALVDKFNKKYKVTKAIEHRLQQEYGLALKTNIEKDIRANLNIRVAEVPRAFNYNKGKLTLRGGFYKDVIPQHYNGGVRNHTPFELALISKGWMSREQNAIAPTTLNRRKYGDILSRANKKSSKMFVVRHNENRGSLKSGIYQREGKRLKLLIIFVNKGKYKKRLDMKRVINKTIKELQSKVFID